MAKTVETRIGIRVFRLGKVDWPVPDDLNGPGFGGDPLTGEGRTARGKRTLERLLSAAEAVFGDKGFYRASIHDITVAAGIGQGTFYFYFPGKLEIFRALLMELSRQLRQVTSEAAARATTRLESERLALDAFFRFAVSHRNLYRLIRTAEWVDPGLGRQYYETFAMAYARVLERAQARGELRRMDPETMAYCLIGVAEAMHMRWMEWEGRTPPDEVVEAVISFMANGISRERGADKDAAH